MAEMWNVECTVYCVCGHSKAEHSCYVGACLDPNCSAKCAKYEQAHPKCEYDLPGVAYNLFSLIGGAAMAEPEEIDAAITVLKKELGVGYYDGIGDKFLQEAVNFLEKMKEGK